MIYLLDTNILLSMVRRPKFAMYIDDNFVKPENIVVTSVVVEGELKSFVRRREWGMRRNTNFESLVIKIYHLPHQNPTNHRAIRRY